MLLLADFTLGNLLVAMVAFFFLFLAVWMFFADIFSRHDLSGWGKAAWTLLIFIVPLLGILIYLIARPSNLGQRAGGADARHWSLDARTPSPEMVFGPRVSNRVKVSGASPASGDSAGGGRFYIGREPVERSRAPSRCVEPEIGGRCETPMIKPKKSSILAAAALALAVTLCAASPAGAGQGRLISEVSLNVSHHPTFQGQVYMPGSFRCVEARTVILYAFGTGERRHELGRDRTNAKGKWNVSARLHGATTFRATVKRGRNEWGVSCLAGSSKVKSIRP
jgi:hypothetical protein